MHPFNHDHPVWLLIERLRQFGEYPAGVRAIDEGRRVPGTAFFPSGNGLWDHAGFLPPLPQRPLMLLGHNFGDVEALKEAAKRGMEDLSGPTWRNLLRLLADADVSPHRCFFTNALMGLKDDGKGCTGKLSDDPDYRQRCRDFLGYQIEVLRPGCILALGDDAKDMLERLSPEVAAAWRGPRGGWRNIKCVSASANRGLIRSAQLAGSLQCGVAVIYHPCEMRNLRPVWGETVGLVQAAAALCGV
jgi:uracil-DNA glycosylase